MARELQGPKRVHDGALDLDELLNLQSRRPPPGKASLSAQLTPARMLPALQLIAEAGQGGAPGLRHLTHEVVVNVVLLLPAADRIEADVDAARRIFGAYGLHIRIGARQQLEAPETSEMLNRPRQPRQPGEPPSQQPPPQADRLDEGEPPSIGGPLGGPQVRRQAQVSEEVRELLSVNRTPGVPTAYWLPANSLTNDRRTGFAYTADFFENLVHNEGIVVTDNAGYDVFAHELLHLLAQAGHDDLEGHQDGDVPPENLAYPEDTVREGPRRGEHRGSELSEAQVRRVLSSRYVRRTHPGGAEQSSDGPQLRSSGQGRRRRDPQAVATRGVGGQSTQLPHQDAIQRAFGPHDISGVRAHLGQTASQACEDLGALAYAFGTHVSFRSAPDLHTAAHEAAHVVQQRAGVSLPDGVGQVGDRYERHADAVADAVVAGESAAPLLDELGPASASTPAVQRYPEDVPEARRRDLESRVRNPASYAGEWAGMSEDERGVVIAAMDEAFGLPDFTVEFTRYANRGALRGGVRRVPAVEGAERIPNPFDGGQMPNPRGGHLPLLRREHSGSYVFLHPSGAELWVRYQPANGRDRQAPETPEMANPNLVVIERAVERARELMAAGDERGAFSALRQEHLRAELLSRQPQPNGQPIPILREYWQLHDQLDPNRSEDEGEDELDRELDRYLDEEDAAGR